LNQEERILNLSSPTTVIALNIRAGGTKNALDVVRYLESKKPQVVVLTEWRSNPAGDIFKRWAESRGMHHVSQTDGQTANGVFVASMVQLTAKSVTPAGGKAGVLMHVGLHGFDMLACYFPQMSAKGPFFERCAEIAAEHRGGPYLMVGDLNTGNQIRDRVARSGKYFCAPAFDELSSKASLTDLWRRTHGVDAREWSWFSNRGATRNGFRIDHAFGNEALIDWGNPECDYDHTPRENGWSDHSAITIHLS
jgi:exodeoxyribonuclease III